MGVILGFVLLIITILVVAALFSNTEVSGFELDDIDEANQTKEI